MYAVLFHLTEQTMLFPACVNIGRKGKESTVCVPTDGHEHVYTCMPRFCMHMLVGQQRVKNCFCYCLEGTGYGICQKTLYYMYSTSTMYMYIHVYK